MRNARTRGVVVATAVSLAVVAAPSSARAGGYELPDNGTEALGRGGAFTAKADSPLAMEYNVAGLARQRGTRILVDVNGLFYGVDFTRAGNYPSQPGTAWSGQPYPKVSERQFFPIPALGITTDFGYFKKLTFGAGLFAPHSGGSHNFGVAAPGSNEVATVKGPDGTQWPLPSRYDVTRTNLLVVFPQIAVGYQPIKYLDLGVALQLAYGNFELSNANITPLGNATCQGAQDNNACDAYGVVKASGFSWGFAVAAMAHPTPWLDIGIHYRPQLDLHAGVDDNYTGGGEVPKPYGDNTITPSPPAALNAPVPPSPVSFNTMFPHRLRLGIRYVNRYADDTERFDIELDGIYENLAARTDRWGGAITSVKFKPDVIHSPDFLLGAGGQLTADLAHNYMDVFGVRLGAAYNHRVNDWSRVHIRAGAYFDSAATRYKNTRLDFNTTAKYAATAGLGYTWKGFTINIAYAFVYSPSRTVTNSEVRPVSSFNGTEYLRDDAGNIKDPVFATAVGNGQYDYSTHIVSLGLTFNIPNFKKQQLSPN